MSTRSSTAQPSLTSVASPRPAFIVQGALVGASLAIYGLVLISAGLHHQDLDAYLRAARDLATGKPLYADFLQHPFPDPTLRPAYIYPPVFALLLTPLGLVPPAIAGGIWLVLNQAALAASVWIVLRWLRPPAWGMAAVIAATATFYPLWIDVAQGQANLLVLFLVTAGIAGIIRGDARWGASIGLAAALKLTPALLLVWLLVDRRFRAAGWTIAGFAALTALGAVARFGDSVTFFGRVIPALAHGTAFYANQSLSGLIARVATVNSYTDPWVVVPVASLLTIALVAALAAAWVMRTTDGLTRAAAFLPLLPLASSVTWPHHLVILLPVIWLGFMAIAQRGWPLRPALVLGALLVVFDVVSRWPVGPAYGAPGFRAAQTLDPVLFLVANAMLFGTLALFLVAPWLLRSR